MHNKKAILIAAFGTTHMDALKNSILRTADRVKEEFKEHDVFIAFTAHIVIKILKNREHLSFFNVEEALDDLYDKKYDEVIVQPLHIIAGEEYDYIKGICDVNKYRFKKLSVGRPILYYQGMNNLPSDYSFFIDSIKEEFENEESVILFGHGSEHHANSAYGMLQTVLFYEGYTNVFVATVEGYPKVSNIIKLFKDKNIKSAKLIPLFVVCGDHAKNDMAGNDDSLKNKLLEEGIETSVFLHGLGENDNFINLYIDRIKDAIEGRYEDAGRTKKFNYSDYLIKKQG